MTIGIIQWSTIFFKVQGSKFEVQIPIFASKKEKKKKTHKTLLFNERLIIYLQVHDTDLQKL